MNAERTTVFLMANLGSEMARFFRLKKQGRLDLAKGAASRAQKIIESICDQAEPGARAETLLIKEVLDDAQTNTPRYVISEQDLNSYFAPFAQRILTK